MKNQPQRNTALKPKVIYRDNYILAVYKNKGLSFHDDEHSLVRLIQQEVGFKVYPVHRLDADVDGIVVFGVTPYSADLISKQFTERKVEKFYLGIVLGELTKNLIIRKPIKRKGRELNAETFVWPCISAKGLTLVRIVITTGRFHQIKKHLSIAGYPLIKDSQGAALSAVMISLIHPRSKKRIFFSCFNHAYTLQLWRKLTGLSYRLSKNKLFRFS